MQFVTLSKRNLLTLLHQLLTGSQHDFIKPGPMGPTCVSVVSDEEAYRNRAPGLMHPETEAFIREASTAMKIALKETQTGSNPPAWCYDAAKV